MNRKNIHRNKDEQRNYPQEQRLMEKTPSGTKMNREIIHGKKYSQRKYPQE